MKKLLYTIVVVSILLTACTEKLDIEPTVYQDIDEALKSPDGLVSLKNSSYSYARQVYGRYYYHFAELLPDTGEITFLGTFEEFHDLSNKSLVNTFSYSEASWIIAYRCINGCNLILENLNVVEDADLKATLEGDARFLRALMYFDLVRFFAFPYGDNALSNPGVPLITKGTKSKDQIQYPSRSTVGEIFTFVEQELTTASELLPEEETFFANRYAALAILSRLYMTTNQYAKAAQAADDVINSGYFGLVDNLLDEFNQKATTSEDILAWQQTELDNEGENNNGMAAFYASTEAVGRSEMVISENFILSTYAADDFRGSVQADVYAAADINSMFYVGFGQRPRGIYTSKWMDYKTNMPFIRLAEMYLTRAEANQMLLNSGAAIIGTSTPTDDIKVIRSRAGLDVTTMPDVTIDDIRLEKYKELIFEGHRLHDYKRWQHNVGDIPWNSEALTIPLPKRETDANPNL